VTWWPEYDHEFSDQTGWTKQTWRDIYEARNNRRIPPSPAERSRAEEVLFEWTPLLPEDRRKLVWGWAFSKVGRLTFAAIYRGMGLKHRTAHNRLDRAFEHLAANLNNVGTLWRCAGDIGGCTLLDAVRPIADTLNELPEAQSPRSWNDGSVSVDQPDIRDFSWAQKQAAREAKRRAKSEAGMPKEAA
jgi:hypothetical protein